MMAGVIAAVLIGVIIWGIGAARNNAREASERRESLEEYTGQVRSLLSTIEEPIAEMTGAPASTEDTEAIEGLEASATAWAGTFAEVQANVATLAAAPGAQGATDVFQQAILLYASAAETYRQVPNLEGRPQELMLAKAGEFRDRASAVINAGLAVLETARQDADLEPSGLTAPGSTPQTVPSPAETAGGTTVITPGAPAGGGGGGDGQGGGGQGGAKNKDKGGDDQE